MCSLDNIGYARTAVTSRKISNGTKRRRVSRPIYLIIVTHSADRHDVLVNIAGSVLTPLHCCMYTRNYGEFRSHN